MTEAHVANPTMATRDMRQEPLRHVDFETPHPVPLGQVVERTDIRSSIGPFLHFPEHKTEYPQAATEALGRLYEEYNASFSPLVEANREWDTDYQYCMGPNGMPINYFVQIDMVGLPADYLMSAQQAGTDATEDDLRGRIFEIENSLAMTNMLGELFSQDGQPSQFKDRYRAALDELREKFGKPIALLAATQPKFDAMRSSEFGKNEDEPLTDDEVYEMTGFDAFMGPEEFARHIEEHGGESDYLLYVRSSDPVAKLRDPNAQIDNPLLSDDNMRRIIKANTITMNVDNPAWGPQDPRRINDTKAYLPMMGMAHPVYPENGYDPEEVAAYLQRQGVDEELIVQGKATVRSKPMGGTYGCYGHERGPFAGVAFANKLAKNMDLRGPYVIQPEMPIPSVEDPQNGSFVYIDRNFMSCTGQDGAARFMAGFRSFMPTHSPEAKKGRIHGSSATVWAEIV